MINPERGKLIPVSGNNNSPDMDNAVDVQFNPISLKVTLSNTLKENERNGNSRAAQFVDKSSSSLAVELIFDTTYIDAGEGESQNDIEQGSDVRDQTRKIAERFLKPVEGGEQMEAPKRCLFQWGSFEFVGLVESYEETLDFFSKEGRPLRATVSLKLKEDRFQFRQRNEGVDAATQDTPTLSSTGNTTAGDNNDSPTGNGAPRPNQNTAPVPGGSGNQPGNWRDNALYNAVENPRLPDAPTLALPGSSVGAAVGGALGASAGIKLGAGVSAGSSLASGLSASAGVTPAFSFGNSASLGTRVEGAFNASGSASLNAGQLRTEGAPLTPDGQDPGVGVRLSTPGGTLDTGVGFD